MTNTNNDRAQAMAEALAKAGIVNDEPQADLNPFLAALEAFYIGHGSRDTAAWRELKDGLTAAGVPRAAYYRKLAQLCHRALCHPHMPNELREDVAYARGYFAALLKVEMNAIEGGDKASSC